MRSTGRLCVLPLNVALPRLLPLRDMGPSCCRSNMRNASCSNTHVKLPHLVAHVAPGSALVRQGAVGHRILVAAQVLGSLGSVARKACAVVVERHGPNTWGMGSAWIRDRCGLRLHI